MAQSKREVVVAPLSRAPPHWRVSYANGELLFHIKLQISWTQNKLRYGVFDSDTGALLDEGTCYFDVSEPAAIQDILIHLVRSRVDAASVIVRSTA